MPHFLVSGLPPVPRDNDTLRCPVCGFPVLLEASRCERCGTDFATVAHPNVVSIFHTPGA